MRYRVDTKIKSENLVFDSRFFENLNSRNHKKAWVLP